MGSASATTASSSCEVAYLKFTGVITVPSTPFDSDGELNLNAFEAYADNMVQTGTTGLLVNGSYGEGPSMTLAERKMAAERWIQLAKGRFDPVVVHVGAACLKDAQELAAHAESIGAHGIAASISDSFFKPGNVETLVEYLRLVASAAPRSPIYLDYLYIHSVTGMPLDIGKVISQCKTKIPNFRGVKYASMEIANFEVGMEQCENGKYQILMATLEEELLPWLALGADVIVCHSFMCNVHAKMKRAFDNGDIKEARKIQRYAQLIGYAKRKYGSDIVVTKAILRLLGVDVGPVRLPLVDPSAEQQAALRSDLQDLGFFDAVYK